MANTLTPNGVQEILAARHVNEENGKVFTVQVFDLERVNNRYKLTISDGKTQALAALNSNLSSEVGPGKIEDYSLIDIAVATVNDVKEKRFVIINKANLAAPSIGHKISQASSAALKADGGAAPMEEDIKPRVKAPEAAARAKPLMGMGSPQTASKIVGQDKGNAVPAIRNASSRRIHPLISLNPYNDNWTIRVRVTSKAPMRTYRNTRGEGKVFSVELTDEEGTQIQATAFKETADRFFEMLEMGKVYFISKGLLRLANRRFSTLNNEYEMTLTDRTLVEEVKEDAGSGTPAIPMAKYEFVKLEDLGPHVNGRGLVEVIGVVKAISGVQTIKRKSDGTELLKREMTLADESGKSVVVTLWGDISEDQGQRLEALVDSAPVVAIRALRVSDFGGVSLSTTARSLVLINPDLPEATTLREWYDKGGRDVALVSAGAGLAGAARGGQRSVYSERAVVEDFTQPGLGADKPAYFNVRCHVDFMRADQNMWYNACPDCNKKVVEDYSGWRCEGCNKTVAEFRRRYVASLKVADHTADAWVSVFNEQAEAILGMSADDLAQTLEEDRRKYESVIKSCFFKQFIMRISVAMQEYQGEQRQRITVRALSPIDFLGESKFLLEEIRKLKLVAV